jgi:GT2 family glycosyltransferase
MNIAVVIPSKTISNLVPCLRAVQLNEPTASVVVVDDDVDWSEQVVAWRVDDSVIPGEEPFVFARNANRGIGYAFGSGADAVVLHNDDALLQTPGGFTMLAEIAAQHEDIGIIAPVTNVTGQPLQMRKNVGLRQVPHIAFVSVLIPHRTWEKVGPLDERYCIDYGVEDRDYCEAVNRAGLKVCVHDHVFVDHGSLVSSFRGDPKTPRPYTENYKLFKQKWGLTA